MDDNVDVDDEDEDDVEVGSPVLLAIAAASIRMFESISQTLKSSREAPFISVDANDGSDDDDDDDDVFVVAV